MSYSFSIKAASKAAAKAAVAAKFAEVVQHQPVHAKDHDAVIANAGAAIDLLDDDDARDIAVSCHGSLGWDGTIEGASLTSANIAANAYYMRREAAAA